MKQEHEYRLEQQRLQDAQQGANSTGGGPRTVGGGRPLAPKSLRGGGGGKTSFTHNDGATARSTEDHNLDDFAGVANPHTSTSFKSGNSMRGGAPQAIAVVHAEAVEEDEDVPQLSAAPVKTASKSSVFSRMLKGQK